MLFQPRNEAHGFFHSQHIIHSILISIDELAVVQISVQHNPFRLSARRIAICSRKMCEHVIYASCCADFVRKSLISIGTEVILTMFALILKMILVRRFYDQWQRFSIEGSRQKRLHLFLQQSA